MAILSRSLQDLINGPSKTWDQEIDAWNEQGSRTWDGVLIDQIVQQFPLEVTAQIQDSFTFSEVLITPTPIVREVSDSFTFTERLGGNIPVTRVVSTGSGSFTDSAQRDGVDFNRQPQDSSTFVEQITRSLIKDSGTQILAVVTLLPVADQIVRQVIRNRSPQESVTFVDKLFPVIRNVRTVTVSGAAFADSEIRDVDNERQLADVFSFSDNLEFITSVPGTINVRLQDFFVLSENFLTFDEFMRRPQDTSTFAEQIVPHKFAGVLFGEDLDFIEQLLTFDEFARRLQDANTFSDQITPTAHKARVLQDSFSFSEQAIPDGIFTRLLQEAFDFAERGNRFLAEGGGDSTTRQIQDAFVFADNLFVALVCDADPWTRSREEDKSWTENAATDSKTWTRTTEEDSPWTKMEKDEDCFGGVDWTPSGPEGKP